MMLKKDWLIRLVNPFLWLLTILFSMPCHAQQASVDSILFADSTQLSLFKGYSPLLTSINHDTIIKIEKIPTAFLQFVDTTVHRKSDSVVVQKVLKPFFKPHALTAKTFNTEKLPWQGNEVSFTILLFCFILLASSQFSYGKRLTQVFRACISERYMAQLVRNGDLYNERISLYLFLVFILSIPLLILEVNHHYLNYVVPAGPLGMASTYLLILGIYATLYGLKIMALRVSGVIFKTYSATQEYILTLFVFNLAEGLIVIVFLAFILYADSYHGLQLCLLVLGIMYTYRLFRAFVLGLSESRYSILYLLLFFGCLEILPLIVLAKVMMKYFPA
jgi:hypothetical protein